MPCSAATSSPSRGSPDPQTRDRLAYLAYAIRIIIGRLDQEFAQAGGLAVGFSFGDGD